MTGPDPGGASADDVLAAASAEFLAAARRSGDAFTAMAAEVGAHPDDRVLLDRFRKDLHRLSGSAGTFGLARAGRMAAAMESLVRRWIETPTLSRDRRAPIIATFAAAFHEALSGQAPVPPGSPRRLLIVGVRGEQAAAIVAEAGTRGYSAERLDPAELAEAMDDGAVLAIVTRTALPDAPDVGAAIVVEVGPASADDAGARTLRMAESASAAELLDAIERAARPATGSHGLLVAVDDDPVFRAILGVAAREANLRIVLAADVDSFRRALAASPPDVLVLDIEVGDANGLDLVRELRSNTALARAAIVVLSGHGDEASRRAALAAGANDFLAKPVSVPVLAAKLAAWHARATA